jgi:hypothetical protein
VEKSLEVIGHSYRERDNCLTQTGSRKKKKKKKKWAAAARILFLAAVSVSPLAIDGGFWEGRKSRIAESADEQA